MNRYQQKLNKALKENEVILAYLFGSEAKGLAHQESDVDIGVLFDKRVDQNEYLKREGKLIEIFSEIFPKKEINVVNLSIASPLLKQVVILEGRPLYIRSDSDRILFEVQTLHEYEDYLHLSNIYNQFLDLRLKAI